MKSTKCPQCGLVYWTTAPNCKRCGLPTADFEGERPAEETHYEAAPEVPYTNYETPYYAPMPGRTIGDDVRDDDLNRKLKKDARLFYLIGGLQILLWLAVGHLLILDGIANITLAIFASKFKSRVAAIILLVLTILSVMMAISMYVSGELRINPLAPLILIGRLFASGRIVHSTYMLHKHAPPPIYVEPPPPPSFQNEGAPQWAAQSSSNQWQQTY
jgi:hypothetical protein